jgi:hypothetical protein
MTIEHDDWIKGINRVMSDHEGCPMLVIINDPSGLKLIANFENFALQIGLMDMGKILTAMRFQQACAVQAQTGELKAMEKDMQMAMSGKKPTEVN